MVPLQPRTAVLGLPLDNDNVPVLEQAKLFDAYRSIILVPGPSSIPGGMASMGC